jgi:hypothetical protein
MKNFRILLIFFLLCHLVSTYGQAVSQTFSSSGTYTVPTGYVTTVTIKVWGGGGGSTGGAAGGRNGGGGGGYSESTCISIPPGTYTVTVGAAGTAGVASGGTSSFFGHTATGGVRGGASDIGVGGAGSGGQINVSGGTGGLRVANSAGGGGGAAGSSGIVAAGSNAVGAVGGAGGVGVSGAGSGGAGRDALGLAAVTGSNPGGGAGGLGNGGSGTGGAGGSGLVEITVCSSVLPVKYSSFDATPQKNAIYLKWVTESETNHSHFNVERSTDGENYETLSQVKSDDRTSAKVYEYLDKSPNKGLNFYRLKQVDLDGQYEYSKVVTAFMDEKSSDISFTSNGNNQWNITTPDEASQLTIFDMSGKIINQEGFNKNTIYDSSLLNKGAFIAKVSTSVESKSFRFTVL